MRVTHTIANLVFLAGTILLLIFIVLSGSSHHTPLDKFYWISADTSNISGAPQRAAWTFWGVCERNNYNECQQGPAFPISPVDNWDSSKNIPQKFIDNRNTFYYLSRFSFAFALLALGFAGLAFIIDILAFCLLVVDKVVIFLVSIGLFFLAGFAAFQTAVVVLARNAFSNAGRDTSIGVKSMALLWASVVCLSLVWLNTFSSNIANSYRKHMARVQASKAAESGIEPGPIGDESSFTRSAPPDDHTKEEDNSGGIRFFKIKRNHKTSDEESV